MKRVRPLVVLAWALSSCRTEPRWYVDRIEGGTAVLMDPTGAVRVVSTQSLPPDAAEGSWVTASRRDPKLERELRLQNAARRRELATGDDRQTIVLGR